MILFVVTIYFEEKFATRMITRRGLDRGPHPSRHRASRTPERAVGFFTDFVTKHYGSDVRVEVLNLNLAGGFESMVQSIP
ncbi:MAG: hypothetical protein QXH65_05950 [Thermofilaceae archaeon]